MTDNTSDINWIIPGNESVCSGDHGKALAAGWVTPDTDLFCMLSYSSGVNIVKSEKHFKSTVKQLSGLTSFLKATGFTVTLSIVVLVGGKTILQS